jgi:hypothetical protein
MAMCGGSNKDAQQARADEQARQDRIAQGTKSIDATFAGFDDNFYNQRAQDFSNVALPTLNMERTRTRNDLAYNLANKGLLNSSARRQRENSFEQEVAKQRRAIADQGLSQANSLRASVEDARGRVYNQLLASADPAQATAAATRAQSDLMQPSPVGAIGNFFADWSNVYLANKTASAMNPQTQPLMGGFGSGSRNSSRIVG